MSWWCRRAIGAAAQTPQPQDEQAAAGGHFRSVALVVGATGIVGTSLVRILPLADTPGGPWNVYALSRRPLPPAAASTVTVTHLQVDLTDSAAVAEALAPLTDITHVFYAALSPPHVTANRSANLAMLHNMLSVAVPNCVALAHVCLQTGTKHYTGPAEAIASRLISGNGNGSAPTTAAAQALSPPYTEDMPRLGWPNFYYDQEDVLLDVVSPRGGGGVSWSVHRPYLILGFSSLLGPAARRS